MMPFELVRSRFPALARTENGVPVVHLDAPAGTQVPEPVIEAMARVQRNGMANTGGPFGASRDAGDVVDGARAAVADLFGASPENVVFGQNMTSLTFSMSRAIARSWTSSDRVVVTSLDHDANVTPWRIAAVERGAEVLRADFEPATGRLDPSAVVDLIDERTRLVAVTAASNALGSVTELAPIITAAHAVGALVYVDAVHLSAHRRSEFSALGADFIAASAYKFFGPHTGLVIGASRVLESIQPYKVLPASDSSPDRWETGTQSFESLAGVTAAVDYLASLGDGLDRPARLITAYQRIRRHEDALSARFLAGIGEMPHVRLHGPDADGPDRVSTFAVTVAGTDSADVARVLGDQGIYVWSGNYYAVGVMDHLGLSAAGGAVRIGFVHYTTEGEVDRVLEAIDRMS
jgi:cysteine desulfurase family protein (TIGR01976 family)